MPSVGTTARKGPNKSQILCLTLLSPPQLVLVLVSSRRSIAGQSWAFRYFPLRLTYLDVTGVVGVEGAVGAGGVAVGAVVGGGRVVLGVASRVLSEPPHTHLTPAISPPTPKAPLHPGSLRPPERLV